MRGALPSKLTPEALDLLARLKNVAVYDVGSIELTYTLDDSTHTIAEDAILKMDATGLLIQQIKSSGNCELVICEKLAKLLLMDFYLVWICVSQSAEMVQTMFKMQGIPELEVVKDSTDHSLRQGVIGRDHFESHVLTTPISSSQAGARTVGVATNSQRPTLNPIYARLNGWRDHKQLPTPMTHDPQDDLVPQGKINRTVGVAISSRSLTPTTHNQHDLSPQDTDQMTGVGTRSRSPTLMAGDLQHDPSPQNKINRMPVVVTSSQSRLPMSHDLQRDSSPPDKTDQTSGVVTSGRSPTTIAHDLQQDASPRNKTNQMAGIVISGRSPTPVTRDLRHDSIPQDKTDRMPSMATNSRSPTPITHGAEYNHSLRDKIDRTPSAASNSRGPTPMARDPRDDLMISPQDKTDQTVGTSSQNPTPQAHDLQYNPSLQQTMDHLDPVATTIHPGETVARAEVPIPQPPSLFPYVIPANRPENTQFLGSEGYYPGDLPGTGQHIRDGIAGEHFVSLAVVVQPGLP
jgi:hypothetical protein